MKRCRCSARGFVCSMLLLVLLVGLFGKARPAEATSIFINEIHYDNDGADTGEGVEIAGLAGTDLTGWSLLFYNGSQKTVYDSFGLTGILPDQMNGFGALAFTRAGIQNGSPDGIALVHGTEVVQFLSYEGAFTAAGGLADGLLSTDIGVEEISSTAAGLSLQLSGKGRSYEDFSWDAPAASSFGRVNSGQAFAASAPVPTPEPGTFMLLGLGIAGIAVLQRRSRRR